MNHKVQVQPSGREFTVEAGESILDAALRHGLAFPYGCRSGACGACKGKLLAGDVTYGDNPPRALTDEDRADGTVVLCQAVPAGDVTIRVKEVGATEEIPVKILPTRVERLQRLADDIMRLGLKLPPEERLQFLAGQYIDIIMKDGRRRAFSLANAPHNDAELELHIRRIEGGEFTGHVFEGLKEKDILRIEGPKGSFFLREDSKRPVLLLATGTGFAPIKGILEHAFAEGIKRPLHLYWGGRTRESLYMDAQVREWAEAHENFHYVPVLSQADSEWSGRSGYVQAAAIADLGAQLGGFDVYAAGSPRMVYSARDALVEAGLEAEHYYSDAFEFAEDDTAAKAKAGA